MITGSPLHSKGIKYIEKIPKNNNYGKFNVVNVDRCGEIKKYPISIWKFKEPHPSISKHPTEKSILLLEELIKTYTKNGDLVLDNCMGSGTTGIACLKTNRNFIGIEIDRDYFEISKNRIENLILGK
jgi:site-specific DNA-methyltransferase (adenine-specific)